MIETFAALLFTHAAAAFMAPARWTQAKRRLPVLIGHGALLLAGLALTTGTLHPALAALTALHLAIAAGAARSKPGLALFLTEQAAHLAVLCATAALAPTLWAQGIWAQLPWAAAHLPPLFALAAGAILAIRAGGQAIGLLMAPWAAEISLAGLPGGGRAIGHLERGLIFLMVLGGMPEGIGFLIAAKSVLRFGTVREEAKLSEYVIIGTLASFGWALAAAFGTLALLHALPPLGIPDFTP